MQQSILEIKRRLARLLVEKSYREGDFVLASGRRSDYYFDCRVTALHAEGSWLIGTLFNDLLKDVPVVGVGGMTMGADPLVSATTAISHELGRPLNGLLVRKEAKDHGEGGVFKNAEPRQEQDERDEQDHLAQQREEDRRLCLPERNKALLARDLDAENAARGHINTHGPCGVGGKLRVRREHSGNGAGKEHAHRPHEHGACETAYEQDAERFAHTLSVPRAVVEAHNGLRALRETVQELHAETHRGRKDRHRADGGISGEAEERHIEAHRDEVFRDLHEERREPERETGEKEPHVRQKVLRAQPQRRFFRAEETHDPRARNGLREDRCERRAAHAHAEREHEQRVEHDVERRADRHGEHARCGKALRGDEGVEPE